MTSDDVPRRVRAVLDLGVAEARESAGRHEYDGTVQDLSPEGVRDTLAAVGRAEGDDRCADPHDEGHLQAFEAFTSWHFGTYEVHRRNPLVHLDNLDLACYDREYAPAAERAAARRRHLAAWPDAVDGAVRSLDAVPAPVAEGLLPGVRGLVADVDASAGDVEAAAVRAHARLVEHVAGAAASGDPRAAVGEAALAAHLGLGEAMTVDVDELSAAAEGELARLREMLTEGCARIDPDRPVEAVVADLLRDHPDADGVLVEARALTEQALAFTKEHRLAPWTDGECRVGPAPKSRSWAMAMMSWSAAGEPDAPSWYHVTPPDPSWPADEVEDWLAVFSRTTLPAITVHEVAPGHYAHGRSMRRAVGPVRQNLLSGTFAEGWAHYVEEVALEQGFLDGDPRYAVGVALEALVRVTRLAVSIGLHTASMDVADATRRFQTDALLGLAAARSEARRGTHDIGYGRYTQGKLAILDLREQARERWDDGFSLERLHTAMLDLGSPPLGLLGTALERG